jgi:hypothetical protein
MRGILPVSLPILRPDTVTGAAWLAGNLPGFRLGMDADLRDGSAIAFTGFLILAASGLHLASHGGISHTVPVRQVCALLAGAGVKA